ncbi:unknown [Prevotella sp. CAG:1092]|nr:unknown [Prevotella sp. CAG:1092]
MYKQTLMKVKWNKVCKKSFHLPSCFLVILKVIWLQYRTQLIKAEPQIKNWKNDLKRQKMISVINLTNTVRKC